MEERTVTIKTIGIFTIQKRLEKQDGQKSYAVYKQPGDQYVEDFNSLRKAERFSERSLGVFNGMRFDHIVIDQARDCNS